MSTKPERDQFGVLEDRIVYVKPVDVDDLPDEIIEEVGTVDQLWSVHNSVGEQLALIADLDTADALAREYRYSAMTVH